MSLFRKLCKSTNALLEMVKVCVNSFGFSFYNISFIAKTDHRHSFDIKSTYLESSRIARGLRLRIIYVENSTNETFKFMLHFSRTHLYLIIWLSSVLNWLLRGYVKVDHRIFLRNLFTSFCGQRLGYLLHIEICSIVIVS